MEWKDRERHAEEEEAAGRIDVEAPGYSVLREGAGGFSCAELLRRPLIPAAVLVAVVLLAGAWLMSGESAPVDAERLALIESRLAQLEQRLETTVAAAETVDTREDAAASAKPRQEIADEELRKRIDTLVRRTDRTWAALEKRVAALEKRGAATPAAAVAAPAAGKRPPAKAGIYTVKPGDTLYSIGRRENLSVEKLRRLNNLKDGDPIHPGDRLKVSP